MYSIKAITALTGLSAETLRAWERRYDCIAPQRSESGRRSYTQSDLEKLKLLVGLTRKGHSISKIANLDCEQLRQFQQQATDQQDPSLYLLRDQIVEALQDYRIERCEQLLKRALIANEPLDYARDILLPTLQSVGQLWHEEKINVAQEHMFSSCVKRIVMAMVNNLHQPSANNPSMLFATPSGEPHEFGILLCCLVAAAERYNCFYLGADLPAKDIIDACHHLQPDVVVLGLVKTPPEDGVVSQLESLVSAMEQENSAVWVGGMGAEYWLRHRGTAFPNCELIANIDHFHAKTQQQKMLLS